MLPFLLKKTTDTVHGWTATVLKKFLYHFFGDVVFAAGSVKRAYSEKKISYAVHASALIFWSESAFEFSAVIY